MKMVWWAPEERENLKSKGEEEVFSYQSQEGDVSPEYAQTEQSSAG
jgi:hypothetical protein